MYLMPKPGNSDMETEQMPDFSCQTAQVTDTETSAKCNTLSSDVDSISCSSQMESCTAALQSTIETLVEAEAVLLTNTSSTQHLQNCSAINEELNIKEAEATLPTRSSDTMQSSVFSQILDNLPGLPWLPRGGSAAETKTVKCVEACSELTKPDVRTFECKRKHGESFLFRLGLFRQASESVTNSAATAASAVKVTMDQATQTPAPEDNLYEPTHSSPTLLLHTVLKKFSPTRQLHVRQVETAEKVVQTSTEHLPTDEELCQMTEKRDIQMAAKVNISSKSNSLDLSGEPVDNGNILDKVLRQHQQPAVLEELVLQGKPLLCDIPASIGRYENLVVLSLRDNAIAELPWTVALLKKLERLDLSYNMLQHLPRAIGSLTSLQHLNLEANQLVYLPNQLLRLSNLQTLNVLKNKRLRSPPLQVCTKGVEKLFSELRFRSERHNLWRNQTAWIGNLQTGSQFLFKSLQELCIEAVVTYKVDFLSMPYVPPMVKTYLADAAQDYETKIQLAKCSRCQKYFSCRLTFENHFCKRN